MGVDDDAGVDDDDDNSDDYDGHEMRCRTRHQEWVYANQ